MSVSKVNNMDIIPNASPIRSIKIVAVNMKTLQLACGDLSNIWHQIIQYPVWILAYHT